MIYGLKVMPHMLKPIQKFMDDPNVTEIVCQRPREVGVERASKWEWHHIPEFDQKRLDAIGIVAGNLLSKPFDPEHPICKTVLTNRERATFLQSPVVMSGISFTIRIPSRTKISIDDPSFAKSFANPIDMIAANDRLRKLYDSGDDISFLKAGVKMKKNIAAIGETGHGKTYTIKILMGEIEEEDRLVTVEDSPEFGTLHLRNRVEMIFGSAGVTAVDLVEISLRMRPDRIAIQELRGEEIWAYKRILDAGYRGSFTTWHADRDDPFEPLVDMAKQTPEGRSWDTKELLRYFQNKIDIIVHCHKNLVTNTYSNKIVWFKDVHNA